VSFEKLITIETQDGNSTLLSQNSPSQGGATALILAADEGKLSNVAKLLEQEVALETQDFGGFNALLAAAQGNHHEVVSLLLGSGADIDAAGRDASGKGITALMAAAYMGNIATLKVLVEHKVDLNKADTNGATAFDYAMGENRTEAADFLEAAGGFSGAREKPFHEVFVEDFMQQPIELQLATIFCVIIMVSALLLRIHSNRRQSQYRVVLQSFYKLNNPDKLKDVETILAAYVGNEKAMMNRVREKYLTGTDPEDKNVIRELEQQLDHAIQDEAKKREAIKSLEQGLERATKRVEELKEQVEAAKAATGKQD
jgi:hypothetical protein